MPPAEDDCTANPLAGPWQTPVLSGKNVRLLPLQQVHADGLREAARDGELWNLPYTSVPRPEAMDAEIDRRLALQEAGSMMPFAVLDPAGRLAGMTTYMNIDRTVPRVEIGSTWYAAGVQRTALNTEAKLLLLRYAFASLGCAAVELRTHSLNFRSRRAIERLGAHFDGTLRAERRMPDGSLRDTVVYSMIATEWPAVEAHLTWQLQRPREQAR